MLVRHWKLKTLPPPYFYPPLTHSLTHHPQTLAYLNGSRVLHWIWKCFSTFPCFLKLSCTHSLFLFSSTLCTKDRKREKGIARDRKRKMEWVRWRGGWGFTCNFRLLLPHQSVISILSHCSATLWCSRIVTPPLLAQHVRILGSVQCEVIFLMYVWQGNDVKCTMSTMKCRG